MKKRRLFFTAIIGAGIILASGFTVVDSTGIANWTGSPVDGGAGSTGQCTNCHFGGAMGVPTLSLSATPAFGGSDTNLIYTPGTTYTITITSVGSYSAYGFNCEIINSQNTTGVSDFGTFGVAVSSNCKLFSASTHYPSCASHKTPSTAPFSFLWTAPASGTGYIYTDVNGVNLDATTGGDQVSNVFSYVLTSSVAGIQTHQNNDINLSVFPNPATDRVSIAYTLKDKGVVSVKLYTMNGVYVADLVNETQGVGIQSTTANLPASLAKGLYMVKLAINGQGTTQKLLVR